MDEMSGDRWLALHRVNCLYGCSDCRVHVPASVARTILNPGQTTQTRVPVPPPAVSPPSQERHIRRYCDHGREIGVDYCARCSL